MPQKKKREETKKRKQSTAARRRNKERMNRIFGTQKKVEIRDVRTDLSSSKDEKRLEAVKHVIALMTEGKDVSALFTDVC